MKLFDNIMLFTGIAVWCVVGVCWFVSAVITPPGLWFDWGLGLGLAGGAGPVLGLVLGIGATVGARRLRTDKETK